MLGGDVKTYEKEKFFSYRKSDKEVTLWRDPERTRKEMLEIAPEDAEMDETGTVRSDQKFHQ